MARILVVDDESNIRMMVRLALQHVGHQVSTASDGVEALAAFGSGDAHDLVLLDHRMPGLSGLDVLKAMRARDPDARVVVITAFGTVDLAADAVRAGATDFLRKPFTAEMLRWTVEAGLAPAAATGAAPATDGGASGLGSINGYRIMPQAGRILQQNGDLHCVLTVRAPGGETLTCDVVLPAQVVAAVGAHAHDGRAPDGDRVWQGLATGALANYVWQNAAVPAGGTLLVEDVTPSMRRWIGGAAAA